MPRSANGLAERGQGRVSMQVWSSISQRYQERLPSGSAGVAVPLDELDLDGRGLATHYRIPLTGARPCNTRAWACLDKHPQWRLGARGGRPGCAGGGTRHAQRAQLQAARRFYRTTPNDRCDVVSCASWRVAFSTGPHILPMSPVFRIRARALSCPCFTRLHGFLPSPVRHCPPGVFCSSAGQAAVRQQSSFCARSSCGRPIWDSH